MILQTGKKFAALLFTALLFIAVISGGCGGSSSLSLNPNVDSIVADINTVINGAWRVDTSHSNNVSVDINGTKVNLAVLDFAFFAESADMEDITGTVYLEAVAVLSSDRVMLPLLMDTRSFDTAVEGNTWLLGSETGTLSITLDSTTPQSPLLHVTGRTLFNSINTYLDVTFSKLTADNGPATDDEINTFLNGTWQSPADRQTGGGFVYVGLSLDVPPELPGVPPELPDDGNRTALVGMMPINAAFASIIFNDTDAANKTTTITAQSILTLAPDSGDRINGPVDALMAYNHPVTGLTREFGNIYKLEISNTEKAVLLTHGQQAYFIIATLEQASDSFMQVCSLYELDKKPSGNSVNFTDKTGTLWHSYGANGEVRYSGSREPVMVNFIDLMFPQDGFDINNRSIAVSIAVNLSVSPEPGAAFPEPGAVPSLDVISISMDKTLVHVDNVGHNTLYAETDSDRGERVMITFFSDNIALLNAQVLNHDGDFVNVTAMMRRVDRMNDAFVR